MVDIVQKLIENGHPWSSIQDYSLSETGSFLKAIIKRDADKRIENISNIWLGYHAKKSAVEEIVEDILNSVLPPKTPQEEEKEIQSNWRKLASLMKGRK